MSDDNEYSEQYEPQAPGMSSGTKMILISLGVLGILVVACCGGGIWYIKKNVGMEASQDPVVVRETQQQILKMDVPARFDPTQSMRMKIVVADIQMATFEASGEEKTELRLMKMVFNIEMDQQQAEMQMNQQNASAAQLNEASSETKQYTVDGKEISVKFAHGTLRQHENAPADQVGKEWFAVSSMMSAPGGMVMFSVTGPEDEFDEEEIENMIKSLRFPKEE